MLKRVVQWSIVVGLVLGAAVYASAKSCGECISTPVRMCDVSRCGADCQGSCTCDVFEFFTCSGNGRDCKGVKTNAVEVDRRDGTCVQYRHGCYCSAHTEPFSASRRVEVCEPC